MRLMLLACAVFVCQVAEAGPFRVRSSERTCTSDGCGNVSTTTSRSVVRGSTATAQGVAELQAALGRMAHHGGNVGFEGVGCGSTPDAALNNCCNNGRPVIDQGVARGRDGRWYACRRYSR